MKSAMGCSGCGHGSYCAYLCSFIHFSSGNWQSPSLCYQATGTAPASGGEQTNQDSQGRSFTWLAPVSERGLSGFTQDWLLESASELKGTQEIGKRPF